MQVYEKKKKDISHNDFEKLNEIFCERKHSKSSLTACIAIYRDILIIKKANKKIGIAKVCFESGQKVITGTDLNANDFGQLGDCKKITQSIYTIVQLLFMRSCFVNTRNKAKKDIDQYYQHRRRRNEAEI